MGIKPIASLSEIQSSGDAAFRYRMMREVVEAVRARGELYMPLLNLVTTFIDGLASGRPGGAKKAYLAYLATHLNDLSAAIAPDVFYANYRCGAVHEFNLKKGFAIGRSTGMEGDYVGTQTVKETGEQLTVLNIDRLVDDFVAHVRSLEATL